MAAFMPIFAGIMQGQRDYQDFIQQKQAREQAMQFNALRQKALEAEMARQAAEEKRQRDVAAGYVGQFEQPTNPQTPAPQAPMPGQQSQPMQQTGSAPIGPDRREPWGQMPPGAPQATPQGGAPSGPAPIPPYKSMNQAAQPQGSSLIPEPPKYDWNTAVQKIKATGVTDPQAIMQIMEKNVARLDAEARQKLAWAKEMQAEEDRKSRLQIQERLAGASERRAAADELRAQKYNTKRGASGDGFGGGSSGSGGASSGKVDPGLDAAAWDRIITGHAPPARGGVYQNVMRRVASIAKENGMTTEQLLSASADVKTKLAAKRQFEVRAQNMSRAENVLNREIPNFEQTVDKVNASNVPAFAGMELAARRQLGDPLVTQMDQAADVVFREFEGLVTGNPGTLNVQDVQNAHEAYQRAKTPQQAKAAIVGMHRIIDNAKKGMEDTRKEILDDINKQLNPGAGGGALPSGWSVKVK